MLWRSAGRARPPRARRAWEATGPGSELTAERPINRVGAATDQKEQGCDAPHQWVLEALVGPEEPIRQVRAEHGHHHEDEHRRSSRAGEEADGEQSATDELGERHEPAHERGAGKPRAARPAMNLSMPGPL